MFHTGPYSLQKFSMVKEEKGDSITATLINDGLSLEVSGEAYGTLTAFINALEIHTGYKLRILNYNEHALSAGTRADAIAYVELDVDGTQYVGVAISQDTVSSMFKATLSALNTGIHSIANSALTIDEVA